MKSFFDQAARQELEQRFQKLGAESRPKWGNMTAAQMLDHCTRTMLVPTGKIVLKRGPMSLIGWMFKGMIRSEKPFGRNSPTAAEFLVVDPSLFDVEKSRFEEAFRSLAQGPSVITCHQHSFWGKMTDEDWGLLTYKHLNHHFQQFGI